MFHSITSIFSKKKSITNIAAAWRYHVLSFQNHYFYDVIDELMDIVSHLIRKRNSNTANSLEFQLKRNQVKTFYNMQYICQHFNITLGNNFVIGVSISKAVSRKHSCVTVSNIYKKETPLFRIHMRDKINHKI